MARKRRLRRGSNNDWSMWLLNEDDLEDAQEMLWRGHCPARYVRYDREVYPKWSLVKHYSPQELRAIEAELRAERKAEQLKRAAFWDEQRRLAATGHQFRCERCRRTFFSPIDDAEVEAEFLATFGVPQPADCLAVCEPCFEVLMAIRSAEA